MESVRSYPALYKSETFLKLSSKDPLVPGFNLRGINPGAEYFDFRINLFYRKFTFDNNVF